MNSTFKKSKLAFALLSSLVICSFAQVSPAADTAQFKNVSEKVNLPNGAELVARFNTPGFTNGRSSVVQDKVIETINQAVPGSKIRVAMFIFTQVDTAKALVLASKRGVDVQLVMDGRSKQFRKEKGSAVDILENGFDDNPGINSCSDDHCIKFCSGPLNVLNPITHGSIGGACRGLVVNHNKFYTFSELSTGERNVVFQSSANLEEAHNRRYNDLVEIYRDNKLYDGYITYWEGLKRDHTYLKSSEDFYGDSGIVVHTSPRLFGKDPVVELLKRVNCSIPGSSIKAAYSDMGRQKVAEQLKKLKDQGCKINLIALYNDSLHQPGKKFLLTMDDSLAVMHDMSAKEDNQANTLHTKVMLIDAALDNDNFKSKIVLTGSQNLDKASLRLNDETQLEIHNEDVYGIYLGLWYKIITDVKAAGIKIFNDEVSLQP
jgi:hypothetical protein